MKKWLTNSLLITKPVQFDAKQYDARAMAFGSGLYPTNYPRAV